MSYFSTLEGKEKTNNRAETWHSHINKKLVVNGNHKNFYKIINVFKEEEADQLFRYNQYMSSKLTPPQYTMFKRRNELLTQSVKKYKSYKTNETKLDFLKNIRANFMLGEGQY